LKTREIVSHLKGLEARLRKVEVALQKICNELELAQSITGLQVEPFRYARDELDKEIIKLLLTNKVMTATQIAETLKENRHKIGKRLKRIQRESELAGEKWLEFNPSEKLGHYRAWWVLEGVIKVSK
jgi:urease accessory protein UreF